ncbi:hypothetical protein AB6D11_00940 [Vibrio splendidus]
MFRFIKNIFNSYYAPGLITAIFIVGTGIVENRGFEAPYTDEDIIYYQADLTGKHGSSGRGLSYQVLYDKQGKHDIHVKGYNFNSINNHTSLGYGSPINTEDLHVGLVTTYVDELYYTVYVKAGNNILLSTYDGLERINASNAERFQWRLYTGFLAFIFLSVLFRYLKRDGFFSP